MSDINNLLSKHFLGETNSGEEQSVQLFIDSNPEEYATLKKLWTAENIKVEQYDTAQAWQSVSKKANNKKPTTIYRTLKRVAAVAAVGLVLLMVVLKTTRSNFSGAMIVLESTDSTKEVRLDDGSVVVLNKNSSLHYPKKFEKGQRHVTLIGEAYFDIARDEDRPFKIQTEHSEVEVLGTSFNIDTRQESTEVSVTSGKVQVTSLLSKEVEILVKNQAAIITDQKLETFENDTENFIAWKTGKFVFKEKTIAEVIDLLATYYDNKIILKQMEADCPLSATFDKASLEDILESITLTCNFNLNETNNNYELY